MGTKNNPGRFDCYANADPDEPMFIVLGRDAAAPIAIRAWIDQRIASGKNKPDDEQIVEAREIADAMEQYRTQRAARNPAAAYPFPKGARP